MSKFIVTAPVLALAATAVPAYAQEMPWTGPYVGAHGAFVDTQTKWNGSNIYQTVDGGEGSFTLVHHTDTIADKLSHGEPGGGGRIGFNLQTGQVVLGAEADVTFFSFDRAKTSTSAAATYTVMSHASNLETVRARLGLAVGKAMIFATGGVAFSNLRHSLAAADRSQVIVDGGEGALTIAPAGAAAGAARAVAGAVCCSTVQTTTNNLADSARTRTGWTAGGGAQYKVSSNLAVALTLLHVDFKHRDLADATGTSSIGARVNSKMFIGMLGLNFSF
jgi:opacity protein-like surface antigen